MAGGEPALTDDEMATIEVIPIGVYRREMTAYGFKVDPKLDKHRLIIAFNYSIKDTDEKIRFYRRVVKKWKNHEYQKKTSGTH